MAINTYLSITTLNVNGLNVPIKRHRVAEWVRKHYIYMLFMRDYRDALQNERYPH